MPGARRTAASTTVHVVAAAARYCLTCRYVSLNDPAVFTGRICGYNSLPDPLSTSSRPPAVALLSNPEGPASRLSIEAKLTRCHISYAVLAAWVRALSSCNRLQQLGLSAQGVAALTCM